MGALLPGHWVLPSFGHQASLRLVADLPCVFWWPSHRALGLDFQMRALWKPRSPSLALCWHFSPLVPALNFLQVFAGNNRSLRKLGVGSLEEVDGEGSGQARLFSWVLPSSFCSSSS